MGVRGEKKNRREKLKGKGKRGADCTWVSGNGGVERERKIREKEGERQRWGKDSTRTSEEIIRKGDKGKNRAREE
ncbi:hypothetical protein GCM10020219_080390 [Nonomuraea dietziae]